MNRFEEIAVHAWGPIRPRAVAKRDGAPGPLEDAGIPATRLEELPT